MSFLVSSSSRKKTNIISILRHVLRSPIHFNVLLYEATDSEKKFFLRNRTSNPPNGMNFNLFHYYEQNFERGNFVSRFLVYNAFQNILNLLSQCSFSSFPDMLHYFNEHFWIWMNERMMCGRRLLLFSFYEMLKEEWFDSKEELVWLMKTLLIISIVLIDGYCNRTSQYSGC